MTLDFPDMVSALNDALAASGQPFAFGGAIALTYWGEPRATTDIDINIFLTEEHARETFEVLGRLGVQFTEEELGRAKRDGQVRLLWDRTHIDLFFMNFEFLEAASQRIQRVPYGAHEIPVLSAEDLIVCKVAFNRPKDWIDLADIAEQSGPNLDHSYLQHWLGVLLQSDDQRMVRFREVFGNPGP